MKTPMTRSTDIKFVLYLLLLVFACTPQLEDLPKPSAFPNTPRGNFDAYWEGIRQNYLFFPFQNIDWRRQYEQFAPQVNNATSPNELLEIIQNMSSLLIDMHREIRTPFDTVNSLPKNFTTQYPYINTFNLVFTNYLQVVNSNQVPLVVNNSSGFNDLAGGYLKGDNSDIAYIACFQFGDGILQSEGRRALQSFLRDANQRSIGLILDLRNNPGGLATAFTTLQSYFIKSEHHWGYTLVRLGNNSTDLSPPMKETVQPAVGITYTKPIILLTNRYTFSAAELLTLSLKQLDYITHLGEITGGATGPIAPQSDFTGNFSMPNGWVVQLAQRITLDAGKNIYEGRGVAPDIQVMLTTTSAGDGIDSQLVAAINLLK